MTLLLYYMTLSVYHNLSGTAILARACAGGSAARVGVAGVCGGCAWVWERCCVGGFMGKEARARGRSCALGGHGCTWLAVLKHGGIIGACFKTLLKLRACTPRLEKWHRAE